MAQRALVTGGAGFIGSHIVEALLARGDEVRVLDNLSSGRRENLSGFVGAVEFIEGDVRDEAAVVRAVAGCQKVFHQAAVPSVPRSIEEPRLTHEANLNGALNLLLAARDAGVEAVVMASSSSVYGDTPTLPKHEGMKPAPLVPYAMQKLSMELLGQVYARCYGLNVMSLRYFNVFGPRQDPGSAYAAVIPKFIARLVKGEAPTIFGDGTQTRDFTYVGNVVKGNLLAADSTEHPGLVCNVATGERVSVNELAEALASLLGCSEIKARHDPERFGDVKHSHASIELARETLGYAPTVGFEEGLRRTVEWFREQ